MNELKEKFMNIEEKAEIPVSSENQHVFACFNIVNIKVLLKTNTTDCFNVMHAF